jgi:uncharacterized protein YkwD
MATVRLPTSVLAAFSCLALVLLAGPTGAAAKDGLIAPTKACPNQTDAALPRAAQERAMRCFVHYARERSGLLRLRSLEVLNRSARRKSLDMVRCDSFDHEACGREFTYWIERFGYTRGGCWEAAENIAWGTGEFATPRSIFIGWMRSPGHRANILHSSFRDFGIGLKVGTLDGVSGAFVWTQHFGARC